MPRCADPACGRWRPARLGPKWNLGFRLNGNWYCSRACVETAAREGLDNVPAPAGSTVSLPPLRLGVLLRHLGVLTAGQLDLALNEQRRTGLRLGAQLRLLSLVDSEPIVRALAAQANVSYLTSFDIGRVRGCSNLPITTVRALGLVPFEVDAQQKRLRVAVAAPVPRTAVRALLKLTGWNAEPYLVDDDTWEAALEAYRPAEGVVDATTVPNLSAAAARIAEHAGFERGVTVRHAACDDHTWVRIEGPDRVSDLLVTDAAEDETWPARHTAH